MTAYRLRVEVIGYKDQGRFRPMSFRRPSGQFRVSGRSSRSSDWSSERTNFRFWPKAAESSVVLSRYQIELAACTAALKAAPNASVMSPIDASTAATIVATGTAN